MDRYGGLNRRCATLSSKSHRAYQDTDFEIVEQGKNLEIPVSTPAVFETEKQIDTARLQNTLTRWKYSFIAPDTGDGYLSSKVYDPETNEFFHIKATSGRIRIFPKDDDFSFETFDRVVELIENELVELEHIEKDDD